MTYQEALEFHVAEFDRQVADLRAIMMEPDYDNGESPEVMRIKADIIKIVNHTFATKVCHTRAKDYAKKQASREQP